MGQDGISDAEIQLSGVLSIKKRVELQLSSDKKAAIMARLERKADLQQQADILAECHAQHEVGQLVHWGRERSQLNSPWFACSGSRAPDGDWQPAG